MSKFQKLETIHTTDIFPPFNITPVLWHKGDFCGVERIEVWDSDWPDEREIFVNKSLVKQMKAELKKYERLIQRLCQFVPEDQWDKVHKRLTKLGIDYRGPDNVRASQQRGTHAERFEK